MNAEIIATGTELLLGNIVNTNSQYIAQELSLLGLGVYRITEVGDNPKRLKQALKESLSRSDIVFTTGGLGPTKDDLSKEIAVDVMQMESVLHEPTHTRLRMQFNGEEDRVQNNIKQAYFPPEAIVLNNEKGTAPGCILPSADKMIVLLPGPPHEMRAVFAQFVNWWEKNRADSTIRSRVLRLAGIGESDAAARLGDLLDRENPSLAPLAKPYEVTLRITGRGKSPEEVDTAIAALEQEVRAILSDYVYGADEDTLEGTIVDLLIKKDYTIATAESLTGGLLAATLVNVPGVSDALLAGFVTYSEEEKIRRLHVSRETIAQHTAVSPQVCEEMLDGLREISGADVCVVTTGYAGPEGNDIGLVYIGVMIGNEKAVIRHNFHGDRQQIRNRTTRNALAELWRRLR